MVRAQAKKLLHRMGLRRAHVAAARMAAERTLIAAAPRRQRQRAGGRILCYHSVGQPYSGVNDVTPERFVRHLDLAKEMGYRFAPAREIAESGGGPMDLAVSFDDAWKSVGQVAAPILRKRDIPWSLFVVSGWSEGEAAWLKDEIHDWQELKALVGEDLELGSHSVTHPDFGKLDAEQARSELIASRAKIEQRLGFAPPTFAIPLGQSMNWTAHAHQAAQDAGYEVIYAQAEETRFPGTVPRTFVTHFDNDRIFRALLEGAFDRWEEWS